jgi:GNAT superfamily N-acetyltransferase
MYITFTTEPSATDIKDIRDALRTNNKDHLGHLTQTDLACFTYDDNGKKTSGLCGQIKGNWLMVDYLWVHPDLKGKGLGNKLLQKAETYAKKQNCIGCLLDTFNFQARAFYEKQGYQLQMTLENQPQTIERYFMVKNL